MIRHSIQSQTTKFLKNEFDDHFGAEINRLISAEGDREMSEIFDKLKMKDKDVLFYNSSVELEPNLDQHICYIDH
jgi:hypothetical protein